MWILATSIRSPAPIKPLGADQNLNSLGIEPRTVRSGDHEPVRNQHAAAVVCGAIVLDIFEDQGYLERVRSGISRPAVIHSGRDHLELAGIRKRVIG